MCVTRGTAVRVTAGEGRECKGVIGGANTATPTRHHTTLHKPTVRQVTHIFLLQPLGVLTVRIDGAAGAAAGAATRRLVHVTRQRLRRLDFVHGAVALRRVARARSRH